MGDENAPEGGIVLAGEPTVSRRSAFASARDPFMIGECEPVHRVTAKEWLDVVSWLDGGLRNGVSGRLQAEYPISLRPDAADSQCLIREGNRPLSHAMFHLVAGRLGERRVPVGLIGLVYTEEEARGRGLAGRCVDACVEELRTRGASLAVLWSDRRSFYERLGFYPAGRERLLVLDTQVLASVTAGSTHHRSFDVGAPRTSDWSMLEEMYFARRFRAERRPDDLARLAAAPDVELRVARRDGRPKAYAALGRGDDFAEVVHEWAGEANGVLACLKSLLRDRPALGLMTGPEDRVLVEHLREAGAAQHDSAFGLVRLLDPRSLWKEVGAGVPELAGIALHDTGSRIRVAGGAGSVEISHPQALTLLIDGPTEFDPGPLEPALSREEWNALEKRQSLRLYLWGFDSV